MSWENLIKGQGTFSWVIVLLILITLFLDNVWISLGENLCLSPLGLKGYKSQIKEVKRARTISRCLFYMYQSVHLVEVSVKGESTVFCFLSFRLYGSLMVLVIKTKIIINRGYYMAARRYEISLRKRVKYSQHEKRNFVSPSGHVMFYLLYKYQWNTKPFHWNSFFLRKARFIM